MIKRSSCYLCNSKNIEFFYERPDGLQIYQCTNCAFKFIKEIDFPIQKLYETNYFNNESGYVDYDAFPSTNFLWQSALINLFAKKNKLTILELGCAYGKLLGILSLENKHKLRGIEIVKEAANECKKRNLDVVNGDESFLKKEISNQYDVVFAGEFIEHITDPKKLFAEVDRVTKKDGLIIFSTPNAVSELKSWVGYNRSLEHISYFSKKSLLPVLEDIFGKRNVSYINFVHHGDYDTAIIIIKKSGFNKIDKNTLHSLANFKIGDTEREKMYIPFVFGKFFANQKKELRQFATAVDSLVSRYYLYTITEDIEDQKSLEPELDKSPINSIYWQLKSINLFKRELQSNSRAEAITAELGKARNNKSCILDKIIKARNVFKK